MISFAITTHNEGHYIQQLLDQLIPHCEKTGDEIVVVDDNSTDEYTLQILYNYADQDKIKLHNHALNNNFANHKNYILFHKHPIEAKIINFLNHVTYHSVQLNYFFIILKD